MTYFQWPKLTNYLFKPWPNDRNISAKHIPRLLTQHFANPGQTITTFEGNTSQHCGMQHVARIWRPCCDVLWRWVLKIEQVHMPGHNIVAQTWPNNYTIMKHWIPQMCHTKFDYFQILANNTQHVATRHNTSQQGGQMSTTCCAQQCCDICCAEMLRSFGRNLIMIFKFN